MFLSAWSLLLCLLLAVPGVAGPLGIFQGELISGPQAGWHYVKGRNGMLRRVKLGNARIVYGRAVPLERRDPNPSDDLIKGAVIKVTAEQGSDGEWRARKVVLVHLSANLRDRERATTAAAKLSTSLGGCN